MLAFVLLLQAVTLDTGSSTTTLRASGLVSSEIVTHYAAPSEAAQMINVQTVLVNTSTTIPGVTVTHWRVSISHSHGYKIARVGDRLFRGGGFQFPEIYSIAESLERSSASDDLLAYARFLALLSEPDRVLLPFGDDGGAPVSQQWLTEEPRDWGADTVATLPNGIRLVFTPVLVEDGSRWIPKRYVFLFDERKLLSVGAVVRDRDP